MQLDKALDTACEILSNDTLDEEMIQLFAAQAPVNPLSFPNVDEEQIICISEQLIEILHELHIYTNLTNNQCAFFLFGEERQDGSILFDRIAYDKGKNSKIANFSQITPKLVEFIEEVQNKKLNNKFVVHGHTPGVGIYSDNFSLQDIATYIMISDLHPLIRKDIIQTIGCLFNSSGDINFIFYNKYRNQMYKFPNVCIEYKNGERTLLHAYSKGSYATSRYGR